MISSGEADPGVHPADVLDRLDDEARDRLDPAGMLRAVASGGAQIREAAALISPESLATVAEDGRPRAVLVTGLGDSGQMGELAVALTGARCPVPVVSHHGERLPGWVGSVDLVIAVSCHGDDRETLSATDEALRRGARTVTVGAAGSPLAGRSVRGRAVHLPVASHGRAARANLWAMVVPVLLVLDAVGLLDVPPPALTATADRLDEIAARCGPAIELVDNPAKGLALQLTHTLPILWGASDLAAFAAARGAALLAENAKLPALHGAIPEVLRSQVAVFAGTFGALAGADRAGRGADAPLDRIFWDPVEDGPVHTVARLVVLRDTDELPEVALRAKAALQTADRFGVTGSELRADGEHVLQRLASLVGVLDFVSVYVALLQGIDPSPVEPILSAEKAAISR